MLLMSRRKTTSFTTSCKGTRKGGQPHGTDRSPCRATSHSCKARSNSAKPSKEKEIKSGRESTKLSAQNTTCINSNPTKQGSMVTPSSGPSAPPQTVRKPDGPPPNDFGEISQHPPFGVVKWREGEGYPPMNDIPNQTPDEHIYDEIPTTGEYMGIWELQSKSKDATMSSIDIDPAVPGYRQISNSQPLHLREAKDQSEDDLRKSEPLDLNRFPGLPAPKEGEIYVMGANGVPILVRQDAFDATTPIHYSNGGFPQCENTNCPYAPKGRYPYIDSSQKTLETFRSGGEIIEEPELNLNFPEVPSGGLGGNNKPGNGGGGGAGGGGNDLDFDELARRFDQLKKK